MQAIIDGLIHTWDKRSFLALARDAFPEDHQDAILSLTSSEYAISRPLKVFLLYKASIWFDHHMLYEKSIHCSEWLLDITKNDPNVWGSFGEDPETMCRKLLGNLINASISIGRTAEAYVWAQELEKMDNLNSVELQQVGHGYFEHAKIALSHFVWDPVSLKPSGTCANEGGDGGDAGVENNSTSNADDAGSSQSASESTTSTTSQTTDDGECNYELPYDDAWQFAMGEGRSSLVACYIPEHTNTFGGQDFVDYHGCRAVLHLDEAADMYRVSELWCYKAGTATEPLAPLEPEDPAAMKDYKERHKAWKDGQELFKRCENLHTKYKMKFCYYPYGETAYTIIDVHGTNGQSLRGNIAVIDPKSKSCKYWPLGADDIDKVAVLRDLDTYAEAHSCLTQAIEKYNKQREKAESLPSWYHVCLAWDNLRKCYQLLNDRENMENAKAEMIQACAAANSQFDTDPDFSLDDGRDLSQARAELSSLMASIGVYDDTSDGNEQLQSLIRELKDAILESTPPLYQAIMKSNIASYTLQYCNNLADPAAEDWEDVCTGAAAAIQAFENFTHSLPAKAENFATHAYQVKEFALAKMGRFKEAFECSISHRSIEFKGLGGGTDVDFSSSTHCKYLYYTVFPHLYSAEARAIAIYGVTTCTADDGRVQFKVKGKLTEFPKESDEPSLLHRVDASYRAVCRGATDDKQLYTLGEILLPEEIISTLGLTPQCLNDLVIVPDKFLFRVFWYLLVPNGAEQTIKGFARERLCHFVRSLSLSYNLAPPPTSITRELMTTCGLVKPHIDGIDEEGVEEGIIYESFPNKVTKVGGQVTKDIVLHLVTGNQCPDVIHIMTHGNSKGELSLSGEDFISYTDINQIDTSLGCPAQLVFLATCKGSHVKVHCSHGGKGFPHAFLSQGAGRVVASLANYGDDDAGPNTCRSMFAEQAESPCLPEQVLTQEARKPLSDITVDDQGEIEGTLPSQKKYGTAYTFRAPFPQAQINKIKSCLSEC